MTMIHLIRVRPGMAVQVQSLKNGGKLRLFEGIG